MCGIFAHAVFAAAAPVTVQAVFDVLLGGLRRLEYRGYDSAGICVDCTGGPGGLRIFKAAGNVAALVDALNGAGLDGTSLDLAAPVTNHVGIAHTRWATHGAPTRRNAHPLASGADHAFVVVHNGIISNSAALRTRLAAEGVVFSSDTDTEVIAVLAAAAHAADPASTFVAVVATVMAQLQGGYAVIVQSARFPGELVAARCGSPLLVGVVGGGAEFVLASDPAAIVGRTRTVCHLEEHDVVHIARGAATQFNVSGGAAALVVRPLSLLDLAVEQFSKGRFEHFMLKEIFEQPGVVADVLRGRVDAAAGTVRLGGLAPADVAVLRRARRLVFVAAGSSTHAALAVRGTLEALTDLPVVVECASDFLDRRPPVFRDDACVFVSQSGETADTLACLAFCAGHGAFCVGVTNTLGSAVARRTACGVHLRAGAEIGVASTKAYTAQVAALLLLGLVVSADRAAVALARAGIIAALSSLPDALREALRLDVPVRALAGRLRDVPSMLLIGRGAQFATVLEGALKIKEVAYVPCDGIHAGELKHGPLALIDADATLVVVATRDEHFTKTTLCLDQVAARGGAPVVITHRDEDAITGRFQTLCVPRTHGAVQGIVNIVPLQLLAYHLAVARGHNVDCPRNLAKSVTVCEENA
jgi:glucosamine--fructose-6-phosphate aminotransferase (isomerizing)